MSAPFQKFRIRETYNLLSGWGTFIIKVWPMGPQGQGWMDENISASAAAQDFIRTAVQEKLNKENNNK